MDRAQLVLRGADAGGGKQRSEYLGKEQRAQAPDCSREHKSWSRRDLARCFVSLWLAVWLVCALAPAAVIAQAQPPLALNPEVPLTYRVKPEDTLWDIRALYLRDPWRWQALWVENPSSRKSAPDFSWRCFAPFLEGWQSKANPKGSG
jgi:hypothetical protein